jgi:hypothetical protein
MTSRSKFWLGFLSFVLVTLVIFGISGLTWTDIKHLGTPRNALSIDGETVKIPLPESGEDRLLPEVTPTTSGEYAFMNVSDGEPIRWDPCRPIYYVINTAGGPSGSEQLIFDAVDSVSQATGLSFEFEGYTTEVASFDRELIQEDYGDRFVPVIFGWSTEADEPDLEGTVAGLGGATATSGAYGDQQYLVAGVVILDSVDLQAMMVSGNRRGLARAVIMHEIGHVVGLAHVDDPGELMNPTNSSLEGWGPGDQEGLAIAGAGPCQVV